MLELPHPKYFEGILQLRDCKPEVQEWVLEQNRKDKRNIITKAKKVRGGVDLYFSSQKYLRSLGKRLHENLEGEYKQTRTLHTVSKKTGKPLYRVTVMFRQYPFSKGDVVRYKGDKYQVLSCGNQIRVQNTETGKKRLIKTEEIKYVRT